MKTTQMTSKFLAAAMLLSTVSSVFAVETPAFVKNAWTKTKSAATATGKFFMPTHPTDDQKKSDLIKYGVLAPVVDIAALETNIEALNVHMAEVNADINMSAEAKAVEVGRLEALIAKDEAELSAAFAPVAQKSFFKRNVADQYNTLTINHPNVVKYGAMTAVVTAISALAAVCYKYQLPQRAYNKIKSLFKTEPVLNQIVTKANEMIKAQGKEVKEDLNALISASESAVARAIASCKATSKNLIDAVNAFNAKLGVFNSENNQVNQVSLDKAKEALVKAVDACNAELKAQEVKATLEKNSSNTQPETTTEESTVKPAPVKTTTTTTYGKFSRRA